ncbi:keratin-associated protein 13-1-like [Dipodomys merriami]|uniref:keratin-associated protein 13-1-like n=1 Tax=Dipodomys merriami TaxID=94247 RepID=UPI003855B12D
MSYRCCRNLSSQSFGGCVRYPGISCSNSFSRNLVHSTRFCSPRASPPGCSLRSGCKGSSFQPSTGRTSHVVSSPGARPAHYLKASTLCSPCLSTYAGSRSCQILSCGSKRFCSLGSRSRSGYESGGCRPLSCRIRGFPSIGCKSGFGCPTSLAPTRCHAACYRPLCGSGSRRSAC